MPDSTNAVHVVAAAILDEDGQVLLTRRADEAHQGGLWEFPGGKLEAGESVTDALARELREELGITPVQARPLICVEHEYPDLLVRLDVWLVQSFEGVPRGLEGQPMQWVAKADLRQVAMPPADKPVIDALLLPDAYMVTGAADAEALIREIRQAVSAGVKLVQLRCKSLSTEAYQELAREAADICHAAGSRLLLNADPALVEQSGSDGVHLTAQRLMQANSRPLDNDSLVSASCHNRQEVRQANRLGLDFIVLSPVKPTSSHPGADVLGWDRFSALAAASDIPVYALGGMQAADRETAWQHGGQGVAGISLFRGKP